MCGCSLCWKNGKIVLMFVGIKYNECNGFFGWYIIFFVFNGGYFLVVVIVSLCWFL